MDIRRILMLMSVFIFINTAAQELGSTHINQVDNMGRKQGYWKVFDSTGELKYEGKYINNRPHGEFIYYYPTGIRKALVDHRDSGRVSYARMYHPNGKLMAEGKYIHKEKDSTWKYYNMQDESLALEEFYERGNKQGTWKTFYPSGQVMEIVRYQDGLRQGPWIQYFSDGSIKAEGSYQDDLLDGLYQLRHLNGNMEVSGTYHNGQKDGTWVYLNEIGELLKKEVYNKGRLIKWEERPSGSEEDN